MNWLPLHGHRQRRIRDSGSTIMTDTPMRLELSVRTLLRLMTTGQLRAADIRCLDGESKHCLWRILLMSSARTINAGTRCNGRCAECCRSRGDSVEATAGPAPTHARPPAPHSHHDPSARDLLTCREPEPVPPAAGGETGRGDVEKALRRPGATDAITD
jgi:hypothetical protein